MARKKEKKVEAPTVEVKEVEVSEETIAANKAAQVTALEKVNKPNLARFILKLPKERSKAWYRRRASEAGYGQANILEVIR